MNKDYYEEYYRYERSHWWFIVRSRIIEKTLLRYIKPSSPLKILNVGVATGASSQLLMKFGEVVSVEYDKDCCEFVSGVLNTKVYNNSIIELPFESGSFDLVCAFDVIEHVADHELAVSEMYRVCKPEGHLFVTVPAFMSLWSKHDVINHHERRYRLKQLRTLFKKLNGEETYSSFFNSILFPLIFIFRQFSKLVFRNQKEDQVSSDFEAISTKSAMGRFINAILSRFFSMEIFLLRFMKFPVGVSIIFLWKKD